MYWKGATIQKCATSEKIRATSRQLFGITQEPPVTNIHPLHLPLAPLPSGFSSIFYDRDYMSEAIIARLPCGVTVMHVEGVPPSRSIAGDPGPQPQVIRGHIGSSGWLLVPQAEGNILTTMVLQVDPMVRAGFDSTVV